MAMGKIDFYNNNNMVLYNSFKRSKSSKIFGIILATLILHQILMLFTNFFTAGGVF